MQALLLRFLENGEIQAVGSDQPHSSVDVRVVAATNRNLGTLVANGQFREDLLYRLRVIHLDVPPLRERPEEIQPLTRHYLARAGRELTFSDDALGAFQRYRWPGNVRELFNVVEQLVWSRPNGVIGRFMNFLAAHDCSVGFREFRGEAGSAAPAISSAMPPASAIHAESPAEQAVA
jgi:DNA-binding NtrC family response regulator